jgi:spermidine synthase
MARKLSFKDLLKKPLILFGGSFGVDSFVMFEGDILVHQQHDTWGKVLVVDHDGQRVLSFDSLYEQSRMDLNHPNTLVHDYTRAMLLGLALGKPAHVTLFGLGGGCLVRAVHSINPELHIQAVELRAAVAGIAQDYFGIPTSAQIAIHVADGRDYIVQQPSASTDLIFADMYHAIRADPFQMQQQFFHESRRVLSPDGWLVINCHELPPTDSFFFQTLKQYFKVLLVCTVPGGNYVFYAGKSGLNRPQALFEADIATFELKTRTKLAFLLENLVPVP